MLYSSHRFLTCDILFCFTSIKIIYLQKEIFLVSLKKIIMNQDGYYDNIDLHIRWSDRQDLVLNVEPDELISSIKEKVKIEENENNCSCSH